jgi:plasmid stability protein
MSAIHIRDIEAGTLDALKRLARSHRRSLQGELHVILEHAARLASGPGKPERLRLVTVKAGGGSAWRREEIYDPKGR